MLDIETIYSEHLDRIYGFFIVKTYNKAIAEDLTSETFMILVEKSLDPDVQVRNAGHYLSGIMRNVWLKYLQSKYKEVTRYVENIQDFGEYIDHTLDEAEENGLEGIAASFIAKLPDKQRQILQMRLIEKRSLKEICEATGKDMNYVRTTQKRGIKRLKELLSMEEVASESGGLL